MQKKVMNKSIEEKKWAAIKKNLNRHSHFLNTSKLNETSLWERYENPK